MRVFASTFPRTCRPCASMRFSLQRVVANLVDNALKYSSGEVEVCAHAADGHVVVEVLDRGGASVAPGAGIGLAIARGFASVNGCEVTLEPRAEGGMRAALTVPA